MKNRKIKVFDVKKGKWVTVFEDATDGWFYGTDLAFAPEGDRLMFQSEKGGWNQIYTVNADGSDLEQHTKGRFQVPWVEWTGAQTMVFASTKVDPGERHIYTLNIENGDITKLTERPGYRQDFELSRNNRYLVYEYTYFNEPFELYLLDLKNPEKEIRLTYTIPERFKKINWQRKDYFRFRGRDGETKISMSVLEPLNMQQGKEYPVVVFIHGAGSLQNVYKGWSNSYYREYMFHQYLTAHGFYVMQVDYRHSTGYGREFRDDVTNWMGKYETQDIVDGIKYLAEHYPQADTSRVGTYGGSYGGFMALYATSVAPDYFDAAAALRAVTNWENYYHTNPWYTMPRLGKPETDSLNYARSSPITYVDQLKQPVLILHGLMDNNVGFQDAAQYIHELIQAGNKEFEMMMYPSQRHSFHDPDAWFDEYSRIYEFFNEHLK
jgi:dipeptidyl aminopeptidase/acylaminoacyl peptidase